MLTKSDRNFISFLRAFNSLLFFVGMLGIVSILLFQNIFNDPDFKKYDMIQQHLLYMIGAITISVGFLGLISFILNKKFLNIVDSITTGHKGVLSKNILFSVNFLNKLLLLVFILGIWRFIIFFKLYLEAGRPLLKDNNLPVIPYVLGIYGLCIGIICILFYFINRRFVKIIDKIS